jgi:hypothetical protein
MDQEVIDRQEAFKRKQEDTLAYIRKSLRRIMQDANIKTVTAEYDGYSDDGNVSEITFTPQTLTVSNKAIGRLKDYAWAVAYNLNPGFENEGGGYGTLEWDIPKDSITVDHTYRSEEHQHYEDV